MSQSTLLFRPRVSVLIKALNEAEKIERCLLAAIAEAGSLHGEVILVDSLSQDDTVRIASRYPDVRIVQFLSTSDLGCGAATQLGYQFARGCFIYVLDGDMVLERGFLAKAIQFLEQHPEFAGVGGRLVDTHIRTTTDARRAETLRKSDGDQIVPELGGGGLYRRSTIESVQYLSHRWLPACEEAELGARLYAKGWKLMRLSDIAAYHTGHAESELDSLVRQWKNKRAQAPGMLIRASLPFPWGAAIRKKFWYLLVLPIVHVSALLLGAVFWAVGVSNLLPKAIYFDIGLVALLWVALAIKHRSGQRGLLSIVTWHWYSIASALGFMRGLSDPLHPIAARELRAPSYSAL